MADAKASWPHALILVKPDTVVPGLPFRSLGRVPKFLPSLGLLWTSFASSLLGYMATAMRPRRSSRPRFLATPSSVRNLGTRPRAIESTEGLIEKLGELLGKLKKT